MAKLLGEGIDCAIGVGEGTVEYQVSKRSPVGPSERPITVCPNRVVPEARYSSGFLASKWSSISAFVVRGDH
jgi:hypothetical protein